MILLVIFVVCMLLWLIGVIAPPLPEPYPRVSGICAWIAVLCLFLMAHRLTP